MNRTEYVKLDRTYRWAGRNRDVRAMVALVEAYPHLAIHRLPMYFSPYARRVDDPCSPPLRERLNEFALDRKRRQIRNWRLYSRD